MRPLIDCPSCACLMDTRESACPFCGAVVRRAEGWGVLGLGFMIGLATAACGDKSDMTDTTATSDPSSSTSGTDGTTGTSDGGTTIDDTMVPTSFPGTSAYAGPDSGDSLPDDTTASTSDTDTATDTTAVRRHTNPMLVLDLGDVSENSIVFAPETLSIGARGQGPGAQVTDSALTGKQLQGFGRLDSERDPFSRAFNVDVNDTGLPGDVVDTLVVVANGVARVDTSARICVQSGRMVKSFTSLTGPRCSQREKPTLPSLIRNGSAECERFCAQSLRSASPDSSGRSRSRKRSVPARRR